MPDQTTRPTELDNLVRCLRIGLRLNEVDPIDSAAPRGTQIRRIAAYNALFDLARPGEHRYCGMYYSPVSGPCVLRADHQKAGYDDASLGHMDAEQRDRAIRYLVHSEPDPDKRA